MVVLELAPMTEMARAADVDVDGNSAGMSEEAIKTLYEETEKAYIDRQRAVQEEATNE